MPKRGSEKREWDFATGACYLLRSNSGKGPHTYVGSTACFSRRLRQHNGEISGGARYTKPANRRPWKLWVVVHGFETIGAARSLEHRWKRPGKGLFARGERSKSASERRKEIGIRLAKEFDLKCDVGTF